MAQGMIPMNQPQIEEIPLTIDSRLTGNIYCYKWGHVVQVSFWGVQSSVADIIYSAITGLPVAKYSATGNIAKPGRASNVSVGNAYINTDQRVVNINITDTTALFYGTLIYLSKY